MMKRIVIKVGSNVLTRGDGRLDVTRISALVDQIVWLRKNGYEVILVTSGAVAGGRSEFKAKKSLDSISQRQLFSAIGQVKLMNLYYDLFRENNVHIGQVLTTKENFGTRHLYLNQRSCVQIMLDNGVLPIVNENDTVSITELMFTDNDELSGLVATMMGADTLVLLSNIDGVYNGSPKKKDTCVIPLVYPSDDLASYISDEKSQAGRGGMITKFHIARKVADEGVRVIIANGKTDNILIRLFQNPKETLHTEFVPNSDVASGVKKWIAHSGSFAKGCVHINATAAQALRSRRAASLLMVGVTGVEGDFEEGDIVNIVDPNGNVIAIGRSSYDYGQAVLFIGKHDVRPIVHYDYLYMEKEIKQ